MSSFETLLVPVISVARGARLLGLGTLVAVGTLLGASLLGGCSDSSGFRPMYASTPSNPKLQEKLSSVEIAPIGGKTGQRLRNEMLFQNTGGGVPAEPVYRLTILVTESVGATLVNTTGNSASSVYNLDSKFTLIDIKTKKVLLEGTSHARATFDRNQSIYSNVRASDDAANRTAKTMAEEMKGRIAAFLSSDKV